MSLKRLLDLKEEERLVLVARAAMVTVMPVFILAALFIGAAFFFLTPLLRLGTLGFVIIGVLLVLGFGIGISRLLRWFGTALVLTEKRLFVVQRPGFFNRNVIELSLAKIHTVSYRVKGFLPTVFGYGTLLLATSTDGVPLELPRLPRPDRLQTIIAELLEQYSKGPGDFGEMLQAVSRLSDRQIDMLKEEIERTRRYRGGQEAIDDGGV